MIEKVDPQKENRPYAVESETKIEAESKVDRFAGTLFHPDNAVLYRKTLSRRLVGHSHKRRAF